MTDVLIAQLPEAGEYVQGWLGAAIGIGGSIVSGIFGSSQAKKQARAAAREKRRLSRELEKLGS